MTQSNKNALLEVIGQLSNSKRKLEYYKILTFITQLMLDESEDQLQGAKLTKEFQTKIINIKVRYGA